MPPENGHQLAKAAASATKAFSKAEFVCELDWEQYGDNSALLQGLAEAIRLDATTAIGHYVAAGARLVAARDACQHGNWEDYVRQACLMSPTAARNAMRVAKLVRDRRPDLELIETTRDVLIELSRDGVTDATINAIKERIVAGEAVTGDDVKAVNQQPPADLKTTQKSDEVIDAEYEVTSGHIEPGSYDHDRDRTRLAKDENEDATKGVADALRAAVRTAKAFTKRHRPYRYALADQLTAIGDQIRADVDIKGLDKPTLKGILANPHF